eukprot:scaffold970_cov65-Cylindrotheca_fusiformis.AAC.3
MAHHNQQHQDPTSTKEPNHDNNNNDGTTTKKKTRRRSSSSKKKSRTSSSSSSRRKKKQDEETNNNKNKNESTAATTRKRGEKKKGSTKPARRKTDPGPLMEMPQRTHGGQQRPRKSLSSSSSNNRMTNSSPATNTVVAAAVEDQRISLSSTSSSSSTAGFWRPPICRGRQAVQLTGKERCRAAFIYDKPKNKNDTPPIPPNDGRRLHGVWSSKIPSLQQNPTEVWLFEHEYAPNLKGTTTLYGYWGYRIDIEQDLTVFPPNTTNSNSSSIPTTTTTTTDNDNDDNNVPIRGVWIYPLVMAKTSQLAPGEASFLEVTKTPKLHRLDVGGSWKVFFKKDDENKKKKQTAAAATDELLIFQIKLHLGNDQYVTLFPVKKTDTIGEIRQRFSKKDDKLPKDQRLLLYQQQDILLDDKETLEHYDIGHGAIVEYEGMKLFVQDWDKQVVFQIDVSPQDTILHVKELISNKMINNNKNNNNKVPTHMLRISYEKTLLSKDHGILERYNIPHLGTIQLEPIPLKIQHSIDKITIVPVRPIDTIRQVKLRIAQRANITTMPPKRLLFNDTSLLELEDKRKLIYYSKEIIEQQQQQQQNNKNKNGGGGTTTTTMTTLTLVMVQLFVHYWKTGNIVELEVRPDATIYQVKEAFMKSNHRGGGIPMAHQNLYFQKLGPLESNKSISHYDITSGSTIELLPLSPIPVFLVLLDDNDDNDNDNTTTMANPPQELEVIVDPTDLIEYLKEEAQDEWDIAPNQQFLYFNDTLLEDKVCLVDYGIKEGSKIHIKKG